MAKHFSVSGIAQYFFGMAILAMASRVAMAQTTTLICPIDPSQLQVFGESEPSSLELNEAQSSVAAHFSEETVVASGGRLPAYSTGPLPATFAADTISFSVPHYSMSYTINRLTGSWVSSSGLKRNCQVGKKQF